MEKKLKSKIKKLPHQAGIYFFKNQKKEIIYIGKALSLKNRVNQYLKVEKMDPKTRLMINQAKDLGHQVVKSDLKALLLEAKLIKEYRPKYNLRLKDDKRYLYLAIAKDPFRIYPVRKPELEKNLLDWFGPFPSATAVKEVVRLLRRLFPFCSCRKPPKRQCFYFHLNLCPGWENLNTPEYQTNLKKIRQVLNGQTARLNQKLKKEMKQSAQKLEFEKAAKLKKQLKSLDHLTQGWQPLKNGETEILKALLKIKKLLVKYYGLSPITLNKIEGYDVSNLGHQIIVGGMVTFIDGKPEKGLYRKFKIERLSKKKAVSKQNDPAAIKQIIARRLNHPEWLYPQLILVDGGKPQVSAALSIIREKKLAKQIAVLGLAKKKETIVIPKIKNQKITSWQLLNYSPNSPVLKLFQQIRNEAHRFAQKYYRLLHQKKATF